MFKKLKAELKAAFKLGKCHKHKEDNRQLLTVDGFGDDNQGPAGLSRPRGLRGSLDMGKPGGLAGSGMDCGVNSSESAVASKDVRNSSNCAVPASREASSSPLPHEQQIAHQSRQHQQVLSPEQQQQQLCSQPESPTSPRTPGHVRSDAAAQQSLEPASAGAAQIAGADSTFTSSSNNGTDKTRPSGRAGRHSDARAAAAAEAVARAEAERCSRGPEPSRTPRDEDLGGCPPYATKAVWGLRYTMEDKWAAVPNLIQLPVVLTQAQRKTSSTVKAGGCGCMMKPSKVLAKVSPSSKDKLQDRMPLITQSELASAESNASGSSAASGALDLDSLHYFGVFDGHGGADAARHCAQRMHQVVCETVRTMLSPEDAVTAAVAQVTTNDSSKDTASDAKQQQSQEQQRRQLQAQQPEQQQPELSSPSAENMAAAAPGGEEFHSADSNVFTVDKVTPASLASLAASNGNWLLLALSKSFVILDTEFGVLSEGSYVGSTAVVVLLGATRLWVAHAGDSRAVLGRKGVAVVLTSDHKASRDDEVQRVQAAGGHVWWDRVMGELAVSRAIGDHCLRPYVIPEPEVLMVERSKEDEVLVMASDGLWDVVGNQEAADMAVHSLQAAESAGHSGVAAAKRAATSLTKAALERGTRDNVTVLVVDLRTRAGGVGASSSSNISNHSSHTESSKHRQRDGRKKSSSKSRHGAAAVEAAVAAGAQGSPSAAGKVTPAADAVALPVDPEHSAQPEKSAHAAAAAQI